MTKEYILFGEKYNIWADGCCSYNTDKRTLYLAINSYCNAKCSFCSAKDDKGQLKIDIIKDVLDELIINKNVVNRISITGGEPLLHPNLEEILKLIDSYLDKGLEYYAITTNGIILPEKIDMLNNTGIKYINISRHHYYDELNDFTFKAFSMSKEILTQVIARTDKSIRLNVTITDSLNSSYDIYKYIEFASEVGADKVLFRKEYFGTSDNNLDAIEKVLRSHSYCSKVSNKCKCINTLIDGLHVEYRNVDMKIEQDIELNQDFIRNLILHSDNVLRGGWSKDSKIIYKKERE